MRGISKGGQIHISFGMIFSVIMIIIFIGFAFFAIQKFLGIQKNIQINQFYDSFQNDINAVWNSEQSSQPKSYNVPDSIGKICFTTPASSGGDNMFVYDNSGRPTGSRNIENIDIAAMTSEGQQCFNSVSSKINLVLQKNFSATLVTITH